MTPEDAEHKVVFVLDHGFVRLVDSMGSDLSIVRAARVSYNAAWRAGQDEGSDEKLIRYLWKNKHTTPFEAVELQFEVYAPIFVFRQWHRHRTWTYNELSGRYRELEPIFYVPKPEHIGKPSKDNKQGRYLINDQPWDALIPSMMDSSYRAAFETYKALLEHGVPKELARSVLPLSTYSHMFAKTNLRNLFHFLTLRCHEHAQYEIRVYADAMRSLAYKVAPVACNAWENSQ